MANSMDPVDDDLLHQLSNATDQSTRDAVTAKLSNRHPGTSAQVDNLDPHLTTGPLPTQIHAPPS